jgi:hypothetical protein
MRGGARGACTTKRHHVTTLAATSSRSDPETLAVCEVLAHPRAAFHSRTCGLRRDVVAVATPLIGYDCNTPCYENPN